MRKLEDRVVEITQAKKKKNGGKKRIRDLWNNIRHTIFTI